MQNRAKKQWLFKDQAVILSSLVLLMLESAVVCEFMVLSHCYDGKWSYQVFRWKEVVLSL